MMNPPLSKSKNLNTFLLFYRNLKADIIAHIPPEERGMPACKWLITSLKITLLSSGFHLIFLYRLSYLVHQNLGVLGKFICYFIVFFERHWYSSTISPLANVHGGIIFPHPQGIIIGAEAVIGERAWIFQNVTVGGAPGKAGMPQIGKDSRIFTGAVLTGPINIGNNVVIGANTVVSQNIEDYILVKLSQPDIVALPARLIAKPEKTTS
jgi:serine acetyltransferase